VDFWSTGQAADDPVQVSARSQSPTESLQTMLLSLKVSAGHSAELPEQYSGLSQLPAGGRQIRAIPSKWQLSEQQAPALQSQGRQSG